MKRAGWCWEPPSTLTMSPPRPKFFSNRLYAYFGPNNTNRFPQGYKAALAFAWGDSSPELYDSVIDWVKGRLTGYYQMEIVDALKAWDTDNFPAAQNAVLLQPGL